MAPQVLDVDKASFGAFPQDAGLVLGRLRESVLAVLERLPGPRIRRPSDLRRALEIGNRPAWQLFKLAHAPNPLSEGHNVLGPAPMKRFLRAAAEREVPEPVIQAVADAYAAFLRLVEAHADDRRTFDSIISAYGTAGSDVVDVQHKRAAFRANSHIWGVQAKTMVRVVVFTASAEVPDTLDAGTLAGHVDLRRVRPVPIFLETRVPAGGERGEDRGALERYRLEPLATGDDLIHGASLLKEFCSRPLPEIRLRRSAAGRDQIEVVASGVGNESAVTYVAGYVQRNMPPLDAAAANPEPVATSVFVRLPCEAFIFDVLIDRDLFRPEKAQVSVYGDRTGSFFSTSSPGWLEDSDVLGFRESVVHLGEGTSVLSTPDFPRHAEMVRHALQRLGWDSRRFGVYRCRIEYPILHSIVRLKLTPPPKTGA